ncbi:MAG: RNA methyltransferase [Clostridium sp.]|nr:RNA methyltransferase [Prevotella sp.]MCM1428495.1 RNA methyltransferase [Clostridium sp.]MCM1475875.1 RNA methyltransferase [Muribaculaceae bacterium]
MGKKKNIIELTNTDIDGYRNMAKLPLKVLADNVRSMQNVGAFFRTGDAFLIDELILGGISGVPPHPQITKSALGAEESVAWRHVEDSLEECQRLKSEGWKICVLEQTHGSIPLEEFQLQDSERYVLVVGNEVEGVDQRIVDLADVAVEIPMHGIKHSLNVSVSGGIALWEFYKKIKNKK